MADTGSKLLTNGKDFRDCSLAKNSDLYTTGNEYCAGVPNAISDGDNSGKGLNNGSIGSAKDIEMRNCLLAKNSDLYTVGNEYCAGVPNAISDGDDRGKGLNNGSIGSAKDINKRTSLISKNIFKSGNEYCAGSCNV